MRLVRIRHGGRTLLARHQGERLVVLAEESGHPAADVLREALAAGVDLAGDGASLPLSDVTVLSPLANPSKIVAVGLNYPQHVEESREARPDAPVLFSKFPTCLVGPDEPIRFRLHDSRQVDFEAELGVVIGAVTRDVAETDATGHILGFVACNDVSARDAQFADGQWVRGKSFDSFLPTGPALVTPDELPDGLDLNIRCTLNGRSMQDSRTSQMVFSVGYLVSYLSRFMTLVPGDLILTGTPSGAGFARTPPVFLADGDVVEVTVEGVGRLSNPVHVDRQPSPAQHR